MATNVNDGNTGGGGGSAVTSGTIDLTSIGGVNFLTVEVANLLSTAWLRFYKRKVRTFPGVVLKQDFRISSTFYRAYWLPRKPTLFSALGSGTTPQECGSLVITNANTNDRVAEICIPYEELGKEDGLVKVTNWQALDAISIYP